MVSILPEKWDFQVDFDYNLTAFMFIKRGKNVETIRTLAQI